ISAALTQISRAGHAALKTCSAGDVMLTPMRRASRPNCREGATAMTPIEQHRNAIRARLLEWDGTRPGPADISWRINRELIVVAAWGRAVLLQLAHPLVAAGVGEHSRFSGGLTSGVARLRSTVGAMLALTFGNEDAMVEAAARINAIHDRVRGQLAESAGG